MEKNRSEKGEDNKAEQVKRKVAYYDDDYVEEFVIAESATFPEVSFQYRPLNMIQTSRLTDEVMKTDTVEGALEANLRMLTKHIVGWDIAKIDGSVVDFTKISELRKVDPSVLNKVIGTVRGDDKTPVDDLKALREEVKN